MRKISTVEHGHKIVACHICKSVFDADARELKHNVSYAYGVHYTFVCPECKQNSEGYSLRLFP